MTTHVKKSSAKMVSSGTTRNVNKFHVLTVNTGMLIRKNAIDVIPHAKPVMIIPNAQVVLTNGN